MSINPKLKDISDCLYRLSAKGIIINEGKILLIKEKEGWWGLPGGGIDYGEEIKAALKREIEEELSVPRDKMQIGDNIVLFTSNAVIDGIPKANIYYRVNLPLDGIRSSGDVLDFIWVGREDLQTLNFGPSTSTILEELKSMMRGVI
jgi:8-oxo-dGTP pyrophosphatase MutT (NUDIX family)